MRLQDEYVFDARIEDVWSRILDGSTLAALIPGCEKLEVIASGDYEAVIPIKLLLFKTTLKARLTITEAQEQDYCRFKGTLSGSIGNGSLDGVLQLEDLETRTRLKYWADIEFSGGLEKLGPRIVEASGKARIRQSLDKIGKELAATGK